MHHLCKFGEGTGRTSNNLDIGPAQPGPDADVDAGGNPRKSFPKLCFGELTSNHHATCVIYIKVHS